MNNWSYLFNKFKEKPEYATLTEFLEDEYKTKIVYPKRENLLKAFELTAPENVKVVIVGQDPYHEPNQAMGLCFSVPKGEKLPPSLVNIYKEIENDIGCKMKNSGDLTYLANQGVLLINAYLTVLAGGTLGHKRKEYEVFMKDLMGYLNSLNQPIVFMLWGNFAKKYKKYLNNPTHLILESVHPSPLGANKGGWFGLHQFSTANKFLSENGIKIIDWKN